MANAVLNAPFGFVWVRRLAGWNLFKILLIMLLQLFAPVSLHPTPCNFNRRSNF